MLALLLLFLSLLSRSQPPPAPPATPFPAATTLSAPALEILQLGAALDRGQAYNPTSGAYYESSMLRARSSIEALIASASPPASIAPCLGEWELVLSTVPHGIFRSSPFFLAVQEAFSFAENKTAFGQDKAGLFFKLHELQTCSWGVSKVGRVGQRILPDGRIYSEFDTSIFSLTVIPILGWVRPRPNPEPCPPHTNSLISLASLRSLARSQGNVLGLPESSASSGRGLSSILSMLKSTGDLGGKKAGKEELRGRANDTKDYGDYAELNKESVVRLGANANDKDKMYKKREVNLEYRDEFGRLLTRKEAFRQLCYSFHGYGSGKKKEEKRLKQIDFEQEARDKRAKEDRGTMGALRKAQKTSGKAYLKL